MVYIFLIKKLTDLFTFVELYIRTHLNESIVMQNIFKLDMGTAIMYIHSFKLISHIIVVLPVTLNLYVILYFERNNLCLLLI